MLLSPLQASPRGGLVTRLLRDSRAHCEMSKADLVACASAKRAHVEMVARMNREQKLIDIAFALVLTALDERYRDNFARMTQEERAAWVRHQLRECGFDTEPMGASWGVLKE